MSNYSQDIQGLRLARQEKKTVHKDVYNLKLKNLHATQNRIDFKEKDQLEANKAALKEKSNVLEQLLRKFHQKSPQELIEQWDDSTPIVLLPIRIETKFKKVNNVNELWVRIFPDDIAIHSHEELLTKREVTLGTDYWKDLYSAENEEARKKAWTKLVNTFGANRSAWVALQTKPTNWDEENAEVDDLEFPEHQNRKSSEWTKAPHTKVLPDRFVLMAYRDSKLIANMNIVGEPIDDIVILGPDPLGEDGATPSISQDENNGNRISLGPDFEWVANFDLAVSKGLGFKINLDERDSDAMIKGYDQLFVLGLKNSYDHVDGKELIEDLIQNHHYSRNGFQLLKQGTPTNNTEEESSGFTKSDPFHETSYFIETGDPLFTPEGMSREKVTDGQRMSELLGLDYESLQYIGNSQSKDYSEARAMNTALYAGTLGYFMDSMLSDVVEDKYLKHLRNHFNKYVSGRGPLAPIRIGSQPYGILVTSDFKSWKFPEPQTNDREEFAARLKYFDNSEEFFLNKLYGILTYMEQKWSTLIPNLSQISQTGDAGSSLMDVLGLHPTSVEFFNRVGYSYDYLKNLDEFSFDGKYAEDTVKTLIEASLTTQVLRELGYQSTEPNGTPKAAPFLLHLIFQHYHTKMDSISLIDGLPFSEENKVKFYNESQQKHYIHWLIENAGDEKKLEEKDFGGAEEPKSMLFMMLLNSLLLESSKSIFTLLKLNKIDAKELVRSQKFMNISSAPSVSPWEVFQAPIKTIVPTAPPNESFFQHVHSHKTLNSFNKQFSGELIEQKMALEILKDMSTAALERALVEHIDTLSYRLDAWQTSLFTRRLEEKRGLTGKAEERKQGLYVGAYGYLENVVPKSKQVKIDESALPQALREGNDNLYSDPENGGYVHTPSLNHAAAAAILRNGYLTHASSEKKDMMAVNLTSERIKKAMVLVDGVRNGLTLEVILGYQFERGMHDWSTRTVNPVILNKYLPDFRKAYPIKKTKVPQKGKVTGPEETVEEYDVVNGLALAETTNASPFISVTMNSSEKDAVTQERENLRNTLDAMKDVITAESAYQLALGNFDRAAAVVRSLADGEIPPEIDVINTTRSKDLSITNKVVIQFDATLSNLPPHWDTLPKTLQAKLEPGLNHWVGTSLGDPDKIRCTATAYDEKGENVLNDGVQDITKVVTLKDLNIQAIDFMYLLRSKPKGSDFSELESRIRYLFAQEKSLPDSVVVKIEFDNSGQDPALVNEIKSFAEILPFADSIRKLVSDSRPLHAKDFEPASKELVQAVDNPEKNNIADLKTRLEGAFTDIKGLVVNLEAAKNQVELNPTEVRVNTLRNSIKEISDQGFSMAFPYTSFGFGQAEIDNLMLQTASLLDRFSKVESFYTSNLAKVNAPESTSKQKVSLLKEISKLLLNEDFVILPKFTYNNLVDIEKSSTKTSQLLDYASTKRGNPHVMEEWLEGVSLVRPKVQEFEMMRLFHHNFHLTDSTCRPIQLPFREADNWLAVEYPENWEINNDTYSITQYLPQVFNAGVEQCGLLIDDWVEVMPQKQEVTGLTYHYNQPNSVPPQSILLAVTPEVTGTWKWDDLVNTLRDTFKRAKQRAIEPDKLETTVTFLNKLLPSIISEFSTGKNNISLDFSFLTPQIADQLMNFYTLMNTTDS